MVTIITDITHVAFSVSNLEEATQLYRAVLKKEPAIDRNDEVQFHFGDKGYRRLILFPTKDIKPDRIPNDPFVLDVDDIIAESDRLVKLGLTLLSEEPTIGTSEARFKDKWDNYLILRRPSS